MTAVQTLPMHAGRTGQTARHAIILACHAVWLGGDPHDYRNWLLHEYQRKDIALYIEHLKEAIAALARDPEALLIISGGPTRSGCRISESLSYYLLALKLGLLDDPSLKARVVLEERARDSYENVLYGRCAFAEVAGRMPSSETVVGFIFKELRFKHHGEA